MGFSPRSPRRSARSAAGPAARWKAVSGISLASQGGSAVIADRETGKALTPLYPWNDARPFPYMPRVEAALGRAFWRSRTMRDGAGAGLGRMLWLRATRPSLVAEANIYAGAGEYSYFSLTGAWRQDAGSALQVGCYDARRDCIMREPLDVAGVRTDFVAPMREGHSTHPLTRAAAARLGLQPGIPVAGPYLDHEAGFMAAAGVSPRPLQCSLGTAWVGNFVMDEDASWKSPFQLVVPSPVGKGRLVVQPLLTGNVSWEWALRTFVARDGRRALDRAAALFADSPWPAGDLVSIPWLARPNPFSGAFGAGAFQGVHPATSAADMLRALAAGMVFEFYRIFEQAHGAGVADSLVLGGGAARGAFFRTMFAALFSGVPAYAFADGEYAGARGAVRPFDAAVAAARVERIPRPPAAFAREARRRYGVYMEVFERLYGRVGCAGAITLCAAIGR